MSYVQFGELSCRRMFLVLVVLICLIYIWVVFFTVGRTQKSIASSRYECLFRQSLEMRTVSMFTLGWFLQCIEDLKNNHKNTITALIWKVLDESILAYYHPATKNSGLSNIYCIERKPGAIGTESKSVLFVKIVIILCLDIQRGKFKDVPLSRSDLYDTTTWSLWLTSI